MSFFLFLIGFYTKLGQSDLSNNFSNSYGLSYARALVTQRVSKDADIHEMLENNKPPPPKGKFSDQPWPTPTLSLVVRHCIGRHFIFTRLVCIIYRSTLCSTLILQLLIINSQCLFSQGSDFVIKKQLKDAICVYTILRHFCLQLEEIDKLRRMTPSTCW